MQRVTSSILAVLAAGLLAALGYGLWRSAQPQPLVIQGQIEAQQYAISSKVAGRIDEVLVKKGETIQPGQLVFTIASPELDAKLDQARGGQDAADALAAEANSGARDQEIVAARDKWQQAKAAAELLGKTYGRIDNLFQGGVVAEQKRDEIYTQLQAARYAEDMALQVYTMTKEGARIETKQAAAGKQRIAAGAVAEVAAYAADARVTSRHSGEVAQILLQSGELAPQGFPVVTIIDMADSWAVFQLREDLMAAYPLGREFKVRIPALGETSYPFKVHHVAVMGDYATWRATNTGKGFDMRTFEVEARPLQPIPNLRVGMSVVIVE